MVTRLSRARSPLKLIHDTENPTEAEDCVVRPDKMGSAQEWLDRLRANMEPLAQFKRSRVNGG